jgi:SAM-dependent methyltransferase
MTKMQRDYVQVIYSEEDKPLTNYPKQLASYLFNRFKIKAGDKLLDVGCGRGEFLKGFISCGVKGYGVDRSYAAEKYCPDADLRIANLEAEALPYPDNYFDVVYSKSVIEHFYYPEKLLQEIYRVLKPGGLVITLCPDWEFNYRIYYEDYSHRTPFMQVSLRDIQLISGFENITVERFRQLPTLWAGSSFLLFLAEITRLLVPSYWRTRSKWVRFSKEIMLLSSAIKPAQERTINSYA